MSDYSKGDRVQRTSAWRNSPNEVEYATLMDSQYSEAAGQVVWRVTLDSGLATWWNEATFQRRIMEPRRFHVDDIVISTIYADTTDSVRARLLFRTEPDDTGNNIEWRVETMPPDGERDIPRRYYWVERNFDHYEPPPPPPDYHVDI